MLQTSATNLIAMLLLGASTTGQLPQNGYQVQNRAAQIEQAAKMRSRSTPSEAANVQVNDRRAVRPGTLTSNAPLTGTTTTIGNKPDAVATDGGSVTPISATTP
jgi:hypothetical protein